MNALAPIEDHGVPILDPDARETWDDSKSVPGSHTSLIFAVILKAVTDLFSAGTPEQDRGDAFAFLTAEKGSWADNRDHLCWLVDQNPDVLRARVMDVLEGRREVGNLMRQGSSNLESEHGRAHLAKVRAHEEASREAAKVQAERARERREREAEAQAVLAREAKEKLEEETRIFNQRLKAAEVEAGLRPEHRRQVARAEYLEKDGLPLGHVLRIDEPWEAGTYCTFLETLMPPKSYSMGRAVLAACSAQGFILEHHTRYNLDSLRQASAMLRVDLLFLDGEGYTVQYSSDAASARLRLRPPQRAA